MDKFTTNELLQGESGFEQLRAATKTTSDMFKEVTAVLTERAELDLHYAKTMQKLAGRLTKASQMSSA